MKPILGTLLAIMDKNDILLIQRKKDPYIGFWGLPGGKIELGEHIEDTAIRESKEETGLDVNFVAIRGIISEIINKEDGKDHFINFICEVKPKKRMFKESTEGNLKWVNFDKLQEEKLIPSEWSIIKEFLINKKKINVHRIHVKKDGEKYELESFGV